MDWDYEKTGSGWTGRARNEERADWAEAAVERFREVCRGDNDMTAIIDLIGNMGHLYDRVQATMDTDYEPFKHTFQDIVSTALMHYDAERGEGDDIDQAGDFA